jgi:hypothetical protein
MPPARLAETRSDVLDDQLRLVGREVLHLVEHVERSHAPVQPEKPLDVNQPARGLAVLGADLHDSTRTDCTEETIQDECLLKAKRLELAERPLISLRLVKRAVFLEGRLDLIAGKAE